MPTLPFKGIVPRIAPSAFIAPTAWLTGDVIVEEDASIFFGVVARGDLKQIRIGNGSNVQENAVLHTTHDYLDCVIGDRVTVGHGAIIHGATIVEASIIGMGATILDGAVVEKHCIVGAQSLVPLGMRIPEGSLAVGVPARVVRRLTDKEIAEVEDSSRRYIAVGREYRRTFSHAE